MKRSELHFPGIYKFTNKQNGKVYIGQSGDIFKRLKHHKKLTSSSLFGRALRKYGFEGFTFEVIERVNSLSCLDKREQFWMDFYQSYDSELGYNVCAVASSTRGVPKTQLQIQTASIMCKAQVGEKNPMWGKRHGSETRDKIRQKAKGRRLTPEHRAKVGRPMTPERQALLQKGLAEKQIKKVAQIDVATGLVIRIWDSANQIKDVLNFSKYMIGDACRGYYWCSKRKKYCPKATFKGYIWKYASEGVTPTPNLSEKLNPHN